MRCIYDLRSDIVHGGDGKKLKKTLNSGEITDLAEACAFLENNFRTVTWRLIDLEPPERPYMKKDGWEDMLWS